MPWKETDSRGAEINVNAAEQLITASQITVGDCLAAANLGISIIDELTSQGLDYTGSPFAPYSTKGPYYFNPNRYEHGGVATGSRKSRQATSLHYHRYYGGGERARGSETIKYESYAAFHAAMTGTDVVTLYLLMHRLYEGIEGRAGGVSIKAAESSPDIDAYPEQCEEFSYGIYEPDETVEIATAHNQGTSRVPKREFMNITESNEERLMDVISDRVLRRLVVLGEDATRS